MATMSTYPTQEVHSSAASTLAEPINSTANPSNEKEITKEDAAPSTAASPPEDNYLHGTRLAVVVCSLLLCVFLAALDQTIVGPVIPVISNEFASLSDVGWYVSAYLLTSAALLPLFGRFYRFNLKWVYVTAMSIFEIGSLICALAPNSSAFIVGRAIAGVGVAGGYLGTMVIVAASVPLEKKAFYAGLIGAAYGVGATVGPLIGGSFVNVTWRWAFYINLPIGVPAILVIALFFHPPARPQIAGEDNRISARLLSTAKAIDWVGTALLLGATVSFLIAMQHGGLSKEWSSSEVIGLLVGFGVIIIVFAMWELFVMKENALIPWHIVKQRTIGSAILVNSGVGASYFTILTMLPIYFQIVGSSAIRSGVQMLPLICGVIFAVVLTGGLAPKVGYVQPFLFFGCAVLAIGAGCLSLLDSYSSQAMWAGIGFLTGLGGGSAWQFSFIVVQTIPESVMSQLDMENGASLTLFAQTYFGAIIVSTAQSIFANRYKEGVENIANLPNAAAIAGAGETAFRYIAPPEFLFAIQEVAVSAVQNTFILAAACMALGFFAIFGMEWRSVRGPAASVSVA